MKHLLALTFLLIMIPMQSMADVFYTTESICNNETENGKTVCQKTAGCYWNPDNKQCTRCPAGTYNDGTSPSGCSVCTNLEGYEGNIEQSGYEKKYIGATGNWCPAYINCHYGYTWNDTGKKCVQCEKGEFTSEQANIGFDKQTGFEINDNPQCKKCGENSELNSDSNGCNCIPGYKKDGEECVEMGITDYPIYKLNIYKYRPWVKNDTATITGYLGNPKNLNGFGAKIVIPTAGESVPTFDTTEFKQWFWDHTGSNGPTIEIPPEHTYLYRTNGYFCYTDGTVEELPDTFTTANDNYCGDHSGVAMGQPYDVNAADWSGTAEENKTINIFPEWYYQTYTIKYMPFDGADKSYVPIDSFLANEYIQIRDIADTKFDKWFTESNVASSISGKIFAKNGYQWKTSAGTIYTPGEDYSAEDLDQKLTLYPNVTDCTAGFYCPLPTLESRDLRFKDTKECQEGFYCPAGSSDKTQCGAGNYCPEKSPEPTNCPVGYYCPSTTTGALERTDDTPDDVIIASKCPVGSTTEKAGATAITQCGISNTTIFEDKSKSKFTLPLGNGVILPCKWCTEQSSSI